MFVGRTIAIHVEQITLPSTAPELFSLKNQGLAFQRAAARAQAVRPPNLVRTGFDEIRRII